MLQTDSTTITEIITFLRQTFATTGKTKGVVAVSGGIDSAVSLTLLTQALGPDNVYPVMLPYGDQSTADSRAIIEFNQIPPANWHECNIKVIVDGLPLHNSDQIDPVRLGNAMARVRMILVYDMAKHLNALVCGTENRSEMYLGYFTRFGDEASDIEPIQHLFKTEVRQVAHQLALPTAIQTKAPSAGLWQGQTDETELGFSYDVADQVLDAYSQRQDPQITPELVTDLSHQLSLERAVVQQVLTQVKHMHFKHVVPYTVLGQH